MNKLIPLSLLFLIVFSACKKEKDEPKPEPGTDYVQQDLAAYAHFKTGSYWVYQDSASLIEDSVYVWYDTAFSYYQTDVAQEEGWYMFYNTQSRSFLDLFDYNYKISMGNYILATKEVGCVRVKIKPGDYAGQTYLMSNRFVDGDVIGWYLGAGSNYFKGFWDSLNIGGIYYHNVVKSYDTENRTEFDSPTNFYMAKSIGIVRKEILDSNKVWNLIRYHIVQ